MAREIAISRCRWCSEWRRRAWWKRWVLRSIGVRAPCGQLVCFGNSSGLVPPFSVNGLPSSRPRHAQAAETHRLLESGKTAGTLVLVPDRLDTSILEERRG